MYARVALIAVFTQKFKDYLADPGGCCWIKVSRINTRKMMNVKRNVTARCLLVYEWVFASCTLVERDTKREQVGSKVQFLLPECQLIRRKVRFRADDGTGNANGFTVQVKGDTRVN
jgi:hypothetical protein